MENPTARQQLIAAAFRIITAMQERPPQTVRVIIHDRQTGVRAVVDADAAVLADERLREPLSPVQRAILRVATQAPQSPKKLASLAGYGLNPHFRGALHALERLKMLVRSGHGYSLPEASALPVPPLTIHEDVA